MVDDDKHVVDVPGRQPLGDRLRRDRADRRRARRWTRIEREAFDLVITDVEMPELRGTELLAAILARKPGQLVLLITAFGSVEMAVEAVRAGRVRLHGQAVQARGAAVRDRAGVPRSRAAPRDRAPALDLAARGVGAARREEPRDAAGARLTRGAAARTQSTVLLTGETGTGKGAWPASIHDAGAARARRRSSSSTARRCRRRLIESELFGDERGRVHRRAATTRPALFAAAPTAARCSSTRSASCRSSAQAKLLRVLRDAASAAAGRDHATCTVDVRVVAATNRDARERGARAGASAQDLYFRLNVIRDRVPPLRERRDDIVPLVELLPRARLRERDGRPVPASRRRRLRALLGATRGRATCASWRTCSSARCRCPTTTPSCPRTSTSPRSATAVERALGARRSGKLPLAEIERAYVRRVLEATRGQQGAAARVLGIDRRTLYRKLAP